MSFRVVARSDRLRSQIEHEIGLIYQERFAARLTLFPATLVASTSTSGAVMCAAGIRFSDQRFLSECYLDLPAEIVLQNRCGGSVQRHRIVEICHLVAVSPGFSLSFIADIIEFAESAAADWAIFTATKPLRMLLKRSGMTMLELARAERGRVPNPSDWGTYYDHDPRVMAVRRGAAVRPRPYVSTHLPIGAFANA